MDPELEQEVVDPAADQDEQSGFDAEDEAPTGTIAVEAEEPAPEPEVEYIQLTKAEWEAQKSSAAEIKATQDKSFGTFGRTIKGLQDTLQKMQEGEAVEISQDDIDSLADFPPMVAALEKVRKMRAIPVGFDPAKFDELVQQRMAPLTQAFEKLQVSVVHPDWETYQTGPEFGAWVGTQSAEYQQQLASTWDSKFISNAMSQAKAAAKKVAPAPPAPEPTRKSRLAAAVTPRGSGATRTAVGNDERAGFDAA